ncbi:MAG: class I SAM-dependent methyltransferase [Parvibaculum sp.]|uniref:class I SAM-dependent methyltransferase n=1 Tax=Parvibaculum sp. TaxID=2024848 RepID=UPI003C73A981
MACLICGQDGGKIIGHKNGYRLIECTNCSLRFADPTPTPAELDALYGAYSPNKAYSRKTASKISRTKRRILRYLHMSPGRRFLDAGCNIGTGVEAARLIGLEAHGIDVGNDSIASARELFPLGQYHAGPMESLPTSWGNFDFIYSSEVFEHLPELHGYCAALTARMNPGGLLYLTTPDAGHWRVPANFANWSEVRPPEHIVYFNKQSLAQLLTLHGLDVVKFEWNMKPGLKALARKR